MYKNTNAEKAISDDLQIFQTLDKYERTKNEEELANNLINLVKGKGFNLILNEVANTNSESTQQRVETKKEEHVDTHQINPIFTNPSVPEEVSSPWAEFLRKKKQNQNKESAMNNDIKKNILEPHNAGGDN